MAAGEMGATAPMSGDGGSWVRQVTPRGHPPGVPGTYLSVMRRVGPVGPRASSDAQGYQPCPSSPARRSPPPPPGPCLFHTQNKPGTTRQITSFALLTLCRASTQILRPVLASGQTDTYPRCHGAPQIQPCSPLLSSLTRQLELRAGLRVPSAQSSPRISYSVSF